MWIRDGGQVMAGVRALTGVDLSPPAGGAVRAGGPAAWQEPSPEDAHHYEQQVQARTRGLRERVLVNVDQFLSPSRFLAERMMRWLSLIHISEPTRPY